MSDQLKTALVRAVIGGIVKAGSVFFAGLAAGASTTGTINHTVLVIAGIGAGAAFFAELVIRFGAEGLLDTQAAAKGPGAWQIAAVRRSYDMSWILRIVAAVVVAVFVWLVCLFLGDVLLPALKAEIAVRVGAFLSQYAGLIGLLAGIWYFVAGGGFTLPVWPRRSQPPPR